MIPFAFFKMRLEENMRLGYMGEKTWDMGQRSPVEWAI